LSGFIGFGIEERCIAKKQSRAVWIAATESSGQECWEEGKDPVAERGEGVVDFATPVALADEPGQGQSAGMFADGGEVGADEGTDFLEGQAVLLVDD